VVLLVVNWRWDIILANWREFLAGAWLDVWVASLGFAFACGLGLLIAVMRLSGIRVLSLPAYAWIQVARGIPFYVLMIWVYFGVAFAVGILFTSTQAILICLTITGSGYTAEIFRSGIQAIGTGQVEAAESLGLSRYQMYKDVILPQALRIAIPPLGNTFIGLFKAATVMSVIGVTDIVFLATDITVTYFTPFEAYLTVAAILVVIVFVMSAAVSVAERLVRMP
jgi:His/Glu/Gln/Arg/opine family amino acid ABC transporter permease subunit